RLLLNNVTVVFSPSSPLCLEFGFDFGRQVQWLPASSEFDETADPVGLPHLLGCPTANAEQCRAANQHRKTASPRDRHIETIDAEKKAEMPRQVVGTGCCQRVDNDGGLLALDLVDGPDARAFGQAVAELGHLGVVGSNEQDVR